jgi:hypothetical protein
LKQTEIKEERRSVRKGGSRTGKVRKERENLKMKDRKFKEVVEMDMSMAQRKWSRRNENENSYKERFGCWK